MSWSALPTDYTDAVWSGLRRYIPIDNEDGTVSFQDVTIYDNKEKSFFGASDANDMNKAMNDIMSLLGEATQADAFSNIVSPGGKMTGALTMNNNVSVNSKLSDGTVANLIGRNSSNNLWIGTADEGVMEKQGSVYLATSDTGNAYVSRNNVRDKILDYGFVGKLLWEGNWSSGTISIPETSQYTLFMMYTLTSTGSAMATPILGMKYNTSWIRGLGAYNSSTTLFISTVAITLSGNSWELQQVISNNFTSDVKSNIIISRIYGLI